MKFYSVMQSSLPVAPEIARISTVASRIVEIAAMLAQEYFQPAALDPAEICLATLRTVEHAIKL